MLRNQPLDRRLSSIRQGSSKDYGMARSLAIQRRTGIDYGLDNFSYDPDHLPEWTLPDILLTTKQLPATLQDAVLEWQYAGAAVLTSLDRISQLESESIHRGFPAQSVQHLQRTLPSLTTSSATSSAPSITTSFTDTPPTSYPVSPIDHPYPYPPYPHKNYVPHPLTLGLDSPPITPVDSLISSTPAEQICPLLPPSATSHPSIIVDPDVLAGRLDPLFRRRLDSSASCTSSCVTESDGQGEMSGRMGLEVAEFDGNAWETYANAYRAEIEEVRVRGLPRFRARGFGVRKARIEVEDEVDGVEEEVLEMFDEWWREMRERVVDCEVRVAGCRVPSKERMMEERKKRGFSV